MTSTPISRSQEDSPLTSRYLLNRWVIFSSPGRGGRVVRRCWVIFQCRSVLLIWIMVGQGHVALAVGASGGCLDIFSLIYPFSPLSPSLWETARYRLKYCLKRPLNPKQPTNQFSSPGRSPGRAIVLPPALALASALALAKC